MLQASDSKKSLKSIMRSVAAPVVNMHMQSPLTPTADGAGEARSENFHSWRLETPGRSPLCQPSASVPHFSRTPRPCLDMDAKSPRFIGNCESPHPVDGHGPPCCATRHAEKCNLVEITRALKLHQGEVMAQLQEWMANHEHRLQHSLRRFGEYLDEFRDTLQSQDEHPAKTTDLVKGSVATKLLSLPSRSEYSTTGSKESGRSNSEVETQSPDREHSHASDELVFQRRPSIQSRPSIDSTDSILLRNASERYMSVQEVREQCLTRKPSISTLKPSRTFSFDSSIASYRCLGVSSGLRRVVNSVFFELIFAILICANSILLGVEVAVVSSAPKEEVPHMLYYLTLIFTAAFLVELMMRLVSEGGPISFLYHSELRGWNWFDLLTVISSLIEVGFNFVLFTGGSQSVTRVVRIARMTRLGRVLRIARIVRFISQLRVLVISIMSTLQTLLWALFLLLIIIYVFAVLLAQAAAEHRAEHPEYNGPDSAGKEHILEHYWGTLQAAMYTLFMSVADGVSWEVAVFALAEVHWIWAAFFTCFVAFSSFALINVMTAVFCQSAIESAQRSVDVKWQRMCADKHKHILHLKTLFKSLKHNKKGTISLEKLRSCWNDKAMQQFLFSMDLTPDDCWTFFTVLDAHHESDVSASEFVDGCLRIKGFAKAFDMAVMSYELRHLSKQTITFMNTMQDSMSILLQELCPHAVPPAYESQDETLSPPYISKDDPFE